MAESLDEEERKAPSWPSIPAYDSVQLPPMLKGTDDGAVDSEQNSLVNRLVNSFSRDPNAHVSKQGQIGADGELFDVGEAVAATAASPLHRTLKSRHLQMIAIGGSIGSGLFVGSGKSLSLGGPASVVIAFALIGVMIYTTVQALGEMAVLFPVAGSFSAFSTRFLDPAWGFAMGWNYALQWLVIMPLEIVAASLTVSYWPSGISSAAWVAIFYTVIVMINMFGVRVYGEAEFVFSIIKVVAVVGFIILGIVLNIGGGPNGSYIGGKYWHDPGAFHHGFKGLCSVFVNAAFAFTGTELVGLAAAEAANPRKALPIAIKQVFWRITLFYIAALTVVGLLVPYTDARLLSASSDVDAQASPFVIAIKNAGIEGMDSVMNVVIMIAVLSVGNAAVFGSSRTLAALAEQRQAPHFLSYIDRQGRPLYAILVAAFVGLLGFLAASSKQRDVFTWMMAISGLSSIFTWGSICLAHIRFRRGWQVQGHMHDELPFPSQAGVFGSYLGVVINVLILIAQFWTGVDPVDLKADTPAERAKSFFSVYMAAPIVLLFYFPYKFWFGTKIIRTDSMDLVTGRRDLDIAHLIAEERAEWASWPLWKKIIRFFC